MHGGEHKPARQVFAFSDRDISGEIWCLGECSAHSRGLSCILPTGPISLLPFLCKFTKWRNSFKVQQCHTHLAAFHNHVPCTWIVPESVTAQAAPLKRKFWVTHSPQSLCCHSQLVLICCKKNNCRQKPQSFIIPTCSKQQR